MNGETDLDFYNYQENRGAGFGVPPDYFFRAEREERRRQKKRELRFIGSIAGMCVILYVVLQNALSTVIIFEPIRSLYFTNETFRSLITIILSILGLLLPFVLGGIGLRRKKLLTDLRLERPESKALAITAVPFGFLICLIGNYLTSIFLMLTEDAGVELTAPETTAPDSFAGRIIYVISIAVVPALVEEFALRGVIMQPLRRYGDWFAILATSAVFAILHGNLVQAPFAFIAGIGIGYAVCITDSVWTGIVIHFCNNFYSVAVDFLINDVTDENLLNMIWNYSQFALYAVCIILSVAFVIIRGRKKLNRVPAILTTGDKAKVFFINIPMIVAVIIMLVITAEYVKLL